MQKWRIMFSNTDCIMNKGAILLCFNGLIFLILYFLYKDINIEQPIIYEGDIIYNYSLIKSIIRNGWYVENPFWGNGTFNHFGFNFGNLFQFILIKLISFFTDNIFLIYNIFYFLSYFIVGNTCVYILNIFNIRKSINIFCSILFTFAPFHQLEIAHGICFVDYACIPIFIYFALCLISADEESISWKWLIAAVLSGFSNIYYVFFGCGVLCFGFIINLINYNRKIIRKKIMYFVFILTAVIIGVTINLFPSFLGIISGRYISAERYPLQAETYSLKLIQLLLPRMNHRIQKVANLSALYQNKTGANSAGMMTALGFIGSIGFIYLLFMIFKSEHGIIRNCAWLNVGLLLLGTQGGIGAIVAYVFPQIRAYARICIFILFISILSIGIMLTNVMNQIGNSRLKKNFFVGILMIALMVGILDQTVPLNSEDQDELIYKKNIDEEFVKEISLLNKYDGRIWQMPYTPFGSGGYEWSKGFMFDNNDIIWSGGILSNSMLDAWAEQIDKLDLEVKINQLILEGYNGIWLSRDTFQIYKRLDEYNTLIQELSDILNTQPVYSEDGKFVYFDLKKYMNQSNINGVSKIVFPQYSNDFYDEQNVDAESYLRWCKQDGNINLINPNNEKVLVEVELTLKSVEDSLIIISNEENDIVTLNLLAYQGENVKFEIECLPGSNLIKFLNSAEPILMAGVREVSFCILNDTYLIK